MGRVGKYPNMGDKQGDSRVSCSPLASPIVTRAAHRVSVYAPLKVLVYSSDRATRRRITLAFGHFPVEAPAPLEIVEAATAPAVLDMVQSGQPDLIVLDAEASPYGGIGLAKQLKDELLGFVPIVVLTRRPDDGWLARWSRADAILSHPIDPTELASVVVAQLRSRIAN